jgi:hypothetical protein
VLWGEDRVLVGQGRHQNKPEHRVSDIESAPAVAAEESAEQAAWASAPSNWSGPRQVIQMDTIDLGNVYAFTAIETYTREGQVVLRPGLTSGDGAAALMSVMSYFGTCQVMQTDGGAKFEGEFAAALSQYAGRHRVARPYGKNEQAHIERFNRTVRHEYLSWSKYEVEQITELQPHVEQWLRSYHFVRASMAFEPMQTPMELLLASHHYGLSHLI